MKYSLIALFLALPSLALANDASPTNALEVLLSNLNDVELVNRNDHPMTSSAALMLSEALNQGTAKISQRCEYKGRSFFENCVVSIVTPANPETRGSKEYEFSFSAIRGRIYTKKVRLLTAHIPAT